MRNRTAVQLLYVLAILAGLLPPILFLAYAFRQSAAQVERDLDFVGTGSLVRAENVIDTVGSTLRKVASLSDRDDHQEAVAMLRQAVFLNRFVQAIRVRDGDTVLTSSEEGMDPSFILIGPALNSLPNPGEFLILPPTPNKLQNNSVKIIYSFAPNRAVEALIDPAIFNEFFDNYSHEIGARVFILFDDKEIIASFGKPKIEIPDGVNLRSTAEIQWFDEGIARVSTSKKYPLTTVAVTPTASVSSKWARTAIEFSIAGAAVAALLATLVIRVVRRTRSLEADLREAVRYGELDVHYQPIMDLRTGRCIGAEALMRWNHPQRGMIPAGEFITTAEKTDLILPMTSVMLERVADDLEDTLDADPTLHIGLNLAPQHFASHRIIDSVKEILGSRFRPEQIIYEVTERGLVGDENSPAAGVMKALAGTGSKLAVDDFGTGYSSLSYLQRFPLNYLKIDKVFVDGISDAENSSGLVDQIIRIAKSLNMETIAEGVEHEFQVKYLLDHGVEYAQGWHFARPMPAAKFLEFVAEKNADESLIPVEPPLV